MLKHVLFACIYAISSQNIIASATNRKSRDRNCSSVCCGVPGAAVWGQHKGYQRGRHQKKLKEFRVKCVNTRRRSPVVDVKSCGEDAKRKGADSKWHLETPISEAKPLKTLLWKKNIYISMFQTFNKTNVTQQAVKRVVILMRRASSQLLTGNGSQWDQSFQ